MSLATAPTDQPAGGKGIEKRVLVGGPCFMVWVSRSPQKRGQKCWGGSGLRICGAQGFSGDMRVQGDSLSCGLEAGSALAPPLCLHTRFKLPEICK